jgi:Inner membrane component of T3SS, cytoplasmic domain
MILLLQHQRPDGEIDTYHLKPGRRYHIGRGSACEVRILDLKLSRKHCAIEYGEGAWNIIDLLSTNGCKLDGEQIVGTIPLGVGAHIEAGQTVLTVAQVGDAAGGADHKELHGDDDVAGHDHTATARPLVQEALPEDGTGSAAAEKQDDDSNVWEPEPEADPLNKTDALMPNRRPGAEPAAGARAARGPATKGAEPRRPTAVFRAGDQVNVDHDSDPTQKHHQDAAPLGEASALEAAPPLASTPPLPDPPATKPPTSEERAFYITVLGRRVGPLTRAVARELKARELRGSLTTADLEGYPLA